MREVAEASAGPDGDPRGRLTLGDPSFVGLGVRAAVDPGGSLGEIRRALGAAQRRHRLGREAPAPGLERPDGAGEREPREERQEVQQARREAHEQDRRATLAAITERGLEVADAATLVLNEARFGTAPLADDELESVSRLLRALRADEDGFS